MPNNTDIINHPYTSKTFLAKWLDHFGEEKEISQPIAIRGPFFVKKKFPSLWMNSAFNFTFQENYSIRTVLLESMEKKVHLVYDVPEYFALPRCNPSTIIKLKIIKEYVGYSINLEKQTTSESYMNDRFNSKRRSQFRSYIKKLENAFPISYKMFYGAIQKNEYNRLFDFLYELSVKSFSHKGLRNRKLLPKNFAFLKDVTYPLILEKKASLFVVYDDTRPIGISLNFNSDNILFGDSTVYDMDYSKFNVGIVMIMKQIEWCLENQFKVYDFSKGYFPYKEKWCNRIYHFEHHILYDSKHFSSLITAHGYALYLRLKQYLREHPFRMFLKKKFSSRKYSYATYSIIPNSASNEKKERIDWEKNPPKSLKKAVHDFLFSTSDNKAMVTVYKIHARKGTYIIQGENKSLTVVLENQN